MNSFDTPPHDSLHETAESGDLGGASPVFLATLAQIRRIGQALIEQEEQPGEVASRYNGVFFVDDDEGDMSLVWYVKDGEIIEKAQNSVVPLAHQGITPS